MTPQTIDNYRLTSMEEPSDELLAQLMHEAAEDARQKKAEATARFFGQLKQDAQKTKTSNTPTTFPNGQRQYSNDNGSETTSSG